jgi:hypothetical protein
MGRREWLGMRGAQIWFSCRTELVPQLKRNIEGERGVDTAVTRWGYG